MEAKRAVKNAPNDAVLATDSGRSATVTSVPTSTASGGKAPLSGAARRKEPREELAVSAVRQMDTKEGKSMSYAGVTGSHLRVVIIDKSGVYMDEVQAALLNKWLEDQIYQYFLAQPGTKDSVKPRFEMLPRLASGGLKVEAHDEFSLTWLTSIISGLEGLWMGSEGYRVVSEHELPKYHQGVVLIPNFDGDAVLIRKFLAYFNWDLRIESWPIFAYRMQQEGRIQNHIMVFGIPMDEIAALKARKFRLHYKMAIVYISVRQAIAADVKVPIVEPAPDAPSTSRGVSGEEPRWG